MKIIRKVLKFVINFVDNVYRENLRWTQNPLFFYIITFIYKIFEREVSFKMKISISDSYIADDINAELEELVCVTGKDKQEIICDSLNFYGDYYRKIMRGDLKCML